MSFSEWTPKLCFLCGFELSGISFSEKDGSVKCMEINTPFELLHVHLRCIASIAKYVLEDPKTYSVQSLSGQ